MHHPTDLLHLRVNHSEVESSSKQVLDFLPWFALNNIHHDTSSSTNLKGIVLWFKKYWQLDWYPNSRVSHCPVVSKWLKCFLAFGFPNYKMEMKVQRWDDAMYIKPEVMCSPYLMVRRYGAILYPHISSHLLSLFISFLLLELPLKMHLWHNA